MKTMVINIIIKHEKKDYRYNIFGFGLVFGQSTKYKVLLQNIHSYSFEIRNKDVNILLKIQRNYAGTQNIHITTGWREASGKPVIPHLLY